MGPTMFDHLDVEKNIAFVGNPMLHCSLVRLVLQTFPTKCCPAANMYNQVALQPLRHCATGLHVLT